MNLKNLTLDELTVLARFQLTRHDNVTKEVAEELITRMENLVLPALDRLTRLAKCVTLDANEDGTNG